MMTIDTLAWLVFGASSRVKAIALMPRREVREQSDLGLSDLCLRRGRATYGDRQFEPRGQPEFPENARHVRLDGFHGDGEPVRDVLVGGAGGHEVDEFALARRQLRD